MTAAQIVSESATKHGLVSAQLQRGAATGRPVQLCRAEAMAGIYQQLGWSYNEIGRYFGGFNHTSVIHAVRGVTTPKSKPALTIRELRELRDEFVELRQEVSRLKETVAYLQGDL